jgi:peptidyl-tRNA hydrolase
MTSIEWLDEQLQDTMHIQYGYSDGVRKIVIPIDEYMRLKQIAKEMQKDEHSKTWDTALDRYEVRAGNYMRAYEDFDDYYQENYNQKK